MRILSITAGAAGMYCGSCLHGNTLAAALRALGEDVLLVPLYTAFLSPRDYGDLALLLLFWQWRPIQATVWQVSEPTLAATLSALGVLRAVGDAGIVNDIEVGLNDTGDKVEAKIKKDVAKAQQALRAQAQDFALALAAKILGRKLS